MTSSFFVSIIGILLSKLFGFLRTAVFAGTFGSDAETDIYTQIFGIVTLVFAAVGSSLSTLLLKNLGRAEISGESREKAYVTYFIRRVSLFLLAAEAVLYIFARPIVSVLLYGIDEEYMETAVNMMYIMLPSMFFIVIAYIISGVLRSRGVFFIPSIMSLPYNVIIIMTLLFDGVSIYAVGAVTTVGWALHLIVQLPSFYRRGYRLFYRRGERETIPRGVGGFRESVYILISTVLFQLCLLSDKAFASEEAGMATIIEYASYLFTTITGIFVIAAADVVYPSISRRFGEGDMEYVRRAVSSLLMLMSAIAIPYLLTVSVYGVNIVSLLYERGEFTSEMASVTGTAFIIYSFGLFGHIVQEIFSRILYLSSRYKLTVLWTFGAVAANLALDYILKDTLGVYGIALSTTLIITAYGISLMYSLYHTIGGYMTRETAVFIGKCILSGAAALAVYFIFRFVSPNFAAGEYSFIAVGGICGVAYLAVMAASGGAAKLLSALKVAR